MVENLHRRNPPPKRITILGSNSGRNAGDAAILASIISEISQLCPGVQFEVPTTNPAYVADAYPRELVQPISVMPWNLSIRLLGVPVFRSIRRSDLILITDGIIFDFRLFNLAFNFVLSLVCLAVYARFLGKPMGCYDVGIGPVRTGPGKRLVKFLCDGLDFIMVRDEDSRRLLESLGVTRPPIHTYADVVFNNVPSPPERGQQILKEEGIDPGRRSIGLNLTGYLGAWLGNGDATPNQEQFVAAIAGAVDRLTEDLDVDVLFTTTQVMDIRFSERTIQKVKNTKSVRLITNRKYTHHDLMGLMGHMDLFIGMRLHSLIMASAMATPVIGLVYAPKVESFLKLLDAEERKLSLSEVTENRLTQLVRSTWDCKHALREQLRTKVECLRTKVRESTQQLVDEYLLKDFPSN